MEGHTLSIQSIYPSLSSMPIDLQHEQEPSYASSNSTQSLPYYRHSSTNTVIQLDDILEHIAQYLDHSDLYSCTLVSYLWYTVMNPFLWKQITISESRHDDDFLLTLSKNMNLVCSFQWEYSNWWEHHHVYGEQDFTRSTTGLEQPQKQQHQSEESTIVSRDIVKPCHPPTSNNISNYHNSNNNRLPSRMGSGRPVYRPPTLISFPTTSMIRNLRLEQARSLKQLALDGPFDLIPLLETLVKSCSALKSLCLKNISCIKREELPLDLFLRVSQNLEHWSLRTNAQISLPMITTSINDSEELCHCYNSNNQYTQFLPLALKSLKLDVRTLTGVQLMMILLRCPHLESFSMTEYGLVSPIKDIKGVLLHQQLFLQQRLGTDDQVMVSHSRMSKVLESMPRIIPGGNINNNNNNSNNNINSTRNECVRFSDIGLIILQHFCPRIMHLDLKQAASGRISSRTLQRYLCHNEHLVQLQARSVVIMVEDMINTSTVELLPWKCKNLKSLSVAFGLTWPRDDEQLLHNDGGFVSRESCFTWGERCVYRQLSMLTHLEVLDIPQSFLTVREGTGFEMLTSLSKMEEFSIAGSRINQVERLPTGWFQQHWPKANKVVVASRIYFLKAAPASGLSSNISFMERRKSC